MTSDSEGLHEIANTTDPGRQADIVFVHGLGGASHTTWGWGLPETGFFWPAELAKDLPQCGIWSVGYPAGFTSMGKPGMIIDKRAGNLSQKLANAGLGVRPMIFIAHSMGGLILKSLIVGSQTLADADRKRIVSATRGLVFCSTPHRGSAFADAAGVLSLFFGGSQEHVAEMRANAEPLDILHDEFIEWHRVHQIPIESYAENVGLFRTRMFLRPLPLGLVVPRASANPGIAGHTVRDVDDDHLTLVKPKNRQHDVYAGVLRFIRDTLERPAIRSSEIPPAAAGPEPTASAAAVGPPVVYLSYTLRTRDMRNRALQLADRLRQSGIDSRMDLYFAKSLHGFTPPDPLPNRDSWDAWQESEIRAADRVLVVCSQEYKESPEGSGVERDLYFMEQDVASGAPLRKFIPVGFAPYDANKHFIPSFIRGATYYDLSSGAVDGFGFDDLVRRFRTEFASPPAATPRPAGVTPSAASTRKAPSAGDAYNRALRLLARGDYDEALDLLDQSISLNPSMAFAYYNRGLAHYLRRDDEDEAIADFDRALELGFNDAILFRNRGNAFSRKGDVAGALGDYARAIAMEPRNPIAYLNRGEVYENTLQNERAILDYKTVLTLVCEPQWHDKARARLLALGVAAPASGASGS